MSIVLSHRTARLLYQTVARPDYLDIPVEGQDCTSVLSPPTRAVVEEARSLLAYYGVPAADLETIDVLVADEKDKRALPDVVCHRCADDVPLQSLRRVIGNVYVVSPALCALQAAEDLDFWECVEYFNELCGRYRLPLRSESSYVECRPALNAVDLGEFLAAHPGMHGVVRARRAVRYTRDGARSPMEVALLMMLTMPKSEGGLGLRDVELDHMIPVTGKAVELTTSRYFYADIYVCRAKLVIEYNGALHDALERDAHDNERVNALRAMGYEVITLNRKNFLDAEAFRRTSSAICRITGIKPSRFPSGFQYQQERLRQFVLRRALKPEPKAVPVEADFDDFIC